MERGEEASASSPIRVAVCVPLFDPHINFLPHFVEWYAANKKEYDLRLAWAYKRPLHNAQSAAVNMAREQGCTHILFIEDDHWGFPVDGLEVLLEEDKDVIGFWTCSRKYPFHNLNMRKIDPELSLLQTEVENMRPFTYVEGQDLVQETDLLSWAFTLVKMEVFDKIEDPFTMWGKVPTDSQFCEACDDKEIKRYVHFGCGIPHGEVHPAERWVHQKAEELKRQVRNGADGMELSEILSVANGHLGAHVDAPTVGVPL